MHMHVNKSRHDKTSLRIDLPVCFLFDPFFDLRNNTIFHQYICNFIHPCGRIDHLSILN